MAQDASSSAAAGKESSRFLKKAAQKLFLCWAMGCVGDNANGPEEQSFFASFCSQKEAFLIALRAEIITGTRFLSFAKPSALRIIGVRAQSPSR
ncbi:hypothetical protein [Acidocella sp.]|uniref:hypothetical protein n=1 Tax=Acidocella sp. TaxID=50710 RepID=UPI002F410FDC